MSVSRSKMKTTWICRSSRRSERPLDAQRFTVRERIGLRGEIEPRLELAGLIRPAHDHVDRRLRSADAGLLDGFPRVGGQFIAHAQPPGVVPRKPAREAERRGL